MEHKVPALCNWNVDRSSKLYDGDSWLYAVMAPFAVCCVSCSIASSIEHKTRHTAHIKPMEMDRIVFASHACCGHLMLALNAETCFGSFARSFALFCTSLARTLTMLIECIVHYARCTPKCIHRLHIRNMYIVSLWFKWIDEGAGALNFVFQHYVSDEKVWLFSFMFKCFVSAVCKVYLHTQFSPFYQT